MIFKIKSDKFIDNLDEIINKSKKYFDIFYCDKTLFLGIKKYTQKKNCKKIIKRILYPINNYSIVEINENNLILENPEIKEWCKNKFIELETQQLEDEKQAEIKEYYDFLDIFDKKLKEELLRKEDMQDGK